MGIYIHVYQYAEFSIYIYGSPKCILCKLLVFFLQTLHVIIMAIIRLISLSEYFNAERNYKKSSCSVSFTPQNVL